MIFVQLPLSGSHIFTFVCLLPYLVIDILTKWPKEFDIKSAVIFFHSLLCTLQCDFSCTELLELRLKLQLELYLSTAGLRNLQPGRVLVVNKDKYKQCVAVSLKVRLLDAF